MDGGDPLQWYNQLPPISRLYLTSAVGTSFAVFVDWVSPLTLYFNYDLIFIKGHYWRLVSSFLYFGPFSLDFIFHMYFVVRYCRQLEEGKFRNQPANLIFFLIFGMVCMIILGIFVQSFNKIKFLSHSLSFMMVYVWARGRENQHMRMSLLGLYTFRAPYLPWVLFVFSLMLGNPPGTDLLGIVVGHLYYFLDTVYPVVAEIRQWPLKRIIVTPSVLHLIVGGNRDGDPVIRVRERTNENGNGVDDGDGAVNAALAGPGGDDNDRLNQNQNDPHPHAE
jgi:Derlin-2/3